MDSLGTLGEIIGNQVFSIWEAVEMFTGISSPSANSGEPEYNLRIKDDSLLSGVSEGQSSGMIPGWFLAHQRLQQEASSAIIGTVVSSLITVFIVSLIVIAILIAGGIFVIWRVYKQKQIKEIMSGGTKPRFRKRDKVLFYGRKMLRQVRSISAGASKKKRIISRITRKLLMKKETSPTQLQVLEPPAEYLQEDESNITDTRLPPEVTYMLKSIRIFGVFEKPLFLELCKHMETLRLVTGQYLFRIGEADENFFVVQSGLLSVFITESDGSLIKLKHVKAGDSIASLLSFADVLTGHPQPYKTVSVQALEDSVVLKLPVAAFQDVFEKNPETFVRVIRIIMLRLHRVTFTALHQHLGLTTQLITAPPLARRKSIVYSASPTRRNTQHFQPMYVSGDETSRTPDLLDADIPLNPGQAIEHPQHPNLLLRQGTQALPRKRTSNIPIPSQAASHTIGSSGSFDEPFMGSISFGHNLDSDVMEDVTARATESFRAALGLDEDDLIKITVREVPPGAFITKEESLLETGLMYVISGMLAMSQKEGDKDVFMYYSQPGEFVGSISVLTGEPSIFTVRAKYPSRIAVMTNSDFFDLVRDRPKVVLHVAHLVVQRLSPFVRQIDFAMDWSFLESGRALYKQGEESDSTYIVLSGRLRSVITASDGKKRLVGEYGRGDLVGVVETLTDAPRSTTVIAVRDTELAKLPEGLLNAIKLKYPIVVTRLINLLGRRIIGSLQQPKTSGAVENKLAASNFSTVAVIGVSEDVPLDAFTYELMHSLTIIGTSLRLTSGYVRQLLGSTILDVAHEYRFNSWLAQQEDKHRIVIYQCDLTMTAWTHRCIRQADCILIVGMGDGEPIVGKMEKQLEQLSIRTQRELVLLHRDSGERPKNTALWLNARTWCSSHHHLQCPKRMFSKKAKDNEYYQLIMRTEPNVHSDFSRLARWFTGTSVGLVLGGGGARGAAHVGMIKAIQEAGIPIDMVGGVSIGAFMGALWCSERNITTMTQKAREWSGRMTQWWRQIWDLTYPVTSMFSGHVFNQTIRDTLGDVQIEDLWLPYFTVTTDITSSQMRIHSHGSLWRYVRASMSLSGYMPPLCDPQDGHLLLDGGYCNNLPGYLWRYVRASMSIAGVFPPLCDPEDGHLLVDGCYINNVPGDVMKSLGARHIVAVDVGSQDDTDLTNYGDSLSGWWLLWQRWTSHFRSTSVKVPNLPDIQSRLAYVSCVKQLEEVRNSDYIHYVRPPIDKYKTLQFGSFDEIKEVGYNHGKSFFDGMLKGSQGLPGSPVTTGPVVNAPQILQRVASNRNLNSLGRSLSGSMDFTHLAQLVCKVHGNYSADEYSDEESDDENGYISEPSAEIIHAAVQGYVNAGGNGDGRMSAQERERLTPP